MWKKFLGVILSVSMALTLFGCGTSQQENSSGQDSQGQETTSNGEIDSSEQKELRFLWWGSQRRNDLTLDAISVFEEKNPDIKISPEYTSYETYFDKLTTQVAGGNAPDIIQMDLAWMDAFTQDEVLLNLDPDIESGALSMENVEEAAITSATFNDSVYGVTAGFIALGIIYNSTVFEELGIPEPDPNWTWTDFADIAAEISEKKGDNYYGTLDGSLMVPTAFTLEVFVRQQGRSLFDGRKIGATRDDLIKWFTMWEEMRQSGGATSAEFTANSTWAIETRPITTGSAAMDFDVQNKLEAYQAAMQNPDDVLKIAPFPHDENEVKNGTNVRAGIIMSGNAKTNYPDEVVKFLSFIQNDPDCAKTLSVDRGVPVNTEMQELLKPELSELDTIGSDFVEYTLETMSPIDPPYPAGYAEVEKKLTTTSQTIAYGQMSIPDAVDQFIEEANQILENAIQ